jgi:hypothetical protein
MDGKIGASLKTPKSRLATEAKAEFTLEVNEHFAERSNAEFGVFRGAQGDFNVGWRRNITIRRETVENQL